MLGRFASGITVVTSVSGGVPVGMTCQSFASVSLDPPLVLFCPSRSSTAWPLIRRAGAFCVNVLGRGPGGGLQHHGHPGHRQVRPRPLGAVGRDRLAGAGGGRWLTWTARSRPCTPPATTTSSSAACTTSRGTTPERVCSSSAAPTAPPAARISRRCSRTPPGRARRPRRPAAGSVVVVVLPAGPCSSCCAGGSATGSPSRCCTPRCRRPGARCAR